MTEENRTEQKLISVREYAAKTGFSEGYCHKLWNRLHEAGDENAVEKDGKHLFSTEMLTPENCKPVQDSFRTEQEQNVQNALIEQLKAENQRLTAQLESERTDRINQVAELHRIIDQQQQLSLAQMKLLQGTTEQEPTDGGDAQSKPAEEFKSMTFWQRLGWAFRGK